LTSDNILVNIKQTGYIMSSHRYDKAVARFRVNAFEFWK